MQRGCLIKRQPLLVLIDLDVLIGVAYLPK